jgi:Tfp pilus assembly protein PilO
MLKRLTERERKIFIACVSLVVVYALFRGVFVPFTSQNGALDAKMEKVQKKFIKNEKVIQEAKHLDAKFQRYKENFKQPDTNEQTVSLVLSDIERAASDIKLAISDLKPRPVKSEKYFNYFSVSLSIDGNWIDVIHLLNDLQNAPYFFKVEEMSLERISQRDTNLLKAYIVLSRVYLP